MDICQFKYDKLTLFEHISLGTEYAGQWEKNKFHGNGTRRFKNGNVYNGNYVNGRRHGQGKCHFSNGGEISKGSLQQLK